MYSKIEKKEQRNFEDNIVEKDNDNPKSFYKFINKKISAKEQIIRL